MRDVHWIILHCTAGPQTQKPKNILAYWKSIGWKTPGYHFMIEADGTIHELVPIEKPSNGVKGFNAHSINISYIGGVVTAEDATPEMAKGTPIDNRTPQQRQAMQMLVEKYSSMFPKAVVQGHRDFSPDKNRNGIIEPAEWMKTCPSFSAKAWLQEIGFRTKIKQEFWTVTAETGVNIRTGAGTKFEKAAPALVKGTKVKRLGEVPGWIYVQVVGTSVLGWIHSSFVK